jgi:phosphoadenosine phosphosulfate reductase
LKKMLKLNLKPFLPKISAAHYSAVYGEIPSTSDEEGLKNFSKLVKLEPFQRGMKELAPSVWITALRKSQNQNRAGFDLVAYDETFKCLKVNPILNLTDTDLENYLKQHQLPNEWDYFDPAKADEKRECGLHINWGANAMKT